MSDSNFEELESRNSENILKERMRSVLRDQISVNASPLQQNGEQSEIVSAVVISIPEMASNRKSSWRDRWATIMWSEVPVTGSLEPSIFEEHEKEIRIPVSVKRSGPALISCTVLDSEWDFPQLLLDLFIQGYGKAVFDGTGGERIKGAHTVNIVGMREHSHESIKATSESSSSLKRPCYDTFVPSGQKRRRAVLGDSISYRFLFPTFHHSEANETSNASSYEDVITVFVQRPYADCEQMFVKIPISVEDLQGCTIELQYSYTAELDLDQIVAGLLELGCCTEKFDLKLASFNPPWTLPDGSMVSMFSYAGEPERSRRDALKDHQMQLYVLERKNKKRLLLARPDMIGFEPEKVPDVSNVSAVDALNDFDFDTFLTSYSTSPKLDAVNLMKDHDLQDRQSQLMHLEQQNKKRLLMARQNPVSIESNSTFGSPMSWGQSIAQSPMSVFGSPMSFMTASSPASFMTARSAYTSPALATMNGVSPIMRIETIREDEPPEPSMPPPLRKLRNDYYEHLHQQDIIQPFDKELNWSGKGQHVTFLPKDSVPLTVLSHLGASITAKVDKVLCRRIALARKTMRCSRQWTIADALREVYHLQNLRHFHIVQLVGSYLQGRDFSILMYPVADCHLGIFLEDTADMKDGLDLSYYVRIDFLRTSLLCLTSAIAYVHEHTTKHMDIKPQNILVREAFGLHPWRIYLADFGLSRSFASQGHSQTDGPTSRTPRYCAPEVFKYDRRGRSADIFSLGCVFVEMLTVCAGGYVQDFSEHRSADGDDESFHANLPRVLTWMDKTFNYDKSIAHLDHPEPQLVDLVKQMIQFKPDERPSAATIYIDLMSGPLYPLFYDGSCCLQQPEPYVAYEENKSCTSSSQAPPSTSNNFKPFSPVLSERVLEVTNVGVPGASTGIYDEPTRMTEESPAKRRKHTSEERERNPDYGFMSFDGR
jgi:serine/threonine protein kinase